MYLKKHFDIPPFSFKRDNTNWLLIGVLVLLLHCGSCVNAQLKEEKIQTEQSKIEIVIGAEQTELYFPLLQDRSIAIVANQTSVIGNTHLVDSLLNEGFNIKKVFGPEHGFRGRAADGEHIEDDMDKKNRSKDRITLWISQKTN